MKTLKKISKSADTLPLLMLFAIAVFFSMTSFFFYYSNRIYGHDAGIFAYVGWAMTKGRILYTEVWENKGPLLYFINMFAVLLNRDHGIFWAELIFLFTTLCFAYKTARLMTSSRWVAFTTAFLSITVLCSTLQGGNLSEEYALAFLCAFLYYATKFFLSDFSLKRYEICIVGALACAVGLLRANILAFPAVILLVLVCVLVWQKRFQTLGSVLLYGFIGFALFLLPFLIYFAANHALEAWIQIAYLDVVGSFIRQTLLVRLRSLMEMFAGMNLAGSTYLFVLFFVLFAAALWTKKLKLPQKCIMWCCALGFLLNTWANSLSGTADMHYFMTFMPILVAPLAWMLDGLFTTLRRCNMQKQASNLLIFALALFISFPGLMDHASRILWGLHNGGSGRYIQMENYIKSNSHKDDFVQVVGASPEMVTANFRMERLAASRYSYYAAGSFTQEAKDIFANELSHDIMANPPKFILYTNAATKKDFSSRLEHLLQYEALKDERYTREESDSFGDILVYKRID